MLCVPCSDMIMIVDKNIRSLRLVLVLLYSEDSTTEKWRNFYTNPDTAWDPKDIDMHIKMWHKLLTSKPRTPPLAALP